MDFKFMIYDAWLLSTRYECPSSCKKHSSLLHKVGYSSPFDLKITSFTMTKKKKKQTTLRPYNISLLWKPSSFPLQSSNHGMRREAHSNVLVSPLLLPWRTTVSWTKVTRLSSIVRTGTQLKFRELRNCSRSEKTSPSYRTLNNVVSALMKRRRRSSL